VRYDPAEEQTEDDDETAEAEDDGEEDVEEDEFGSHHSSSSSSSSSSTWDQTSIPQQIHASRMPSTTRNNGAFPVKPGESIIIPITYLPRYPCTLSGGGSPHANADLEDYYSQQAPYQIAFSSTFDPDHEEFSLKQPPPPKLMKLISGTARADWEQLVREMPPQERSNWLEQHKEQLENTPGKVKKIDEHLRQFASSFGGRVEDDYDTNNMDSNSEWLFEVRTTILVETSRGSVQFPVVASSRRQNTFGLPDVIYFDQDDDVNENEEQADANEDMKRGGKNRPSASPHPHDGNGDSNNKNSKTTNGVIFMDTDQAPLDHGADDSGDEKDRFSDDEISPNTSRDCYNLFMTNPNKDKNLMVSEVYVSRPEQMVLQIHGELKAPSSSIREWWNDPRRKNATSENLGNDDDDEKMEPQPGSLIIGPGEQQYVVTVCTTGSTSENPVDTTMDEFNSDDDEAPFTVDSPVEAVESHAYREAARAAHSASLAGHSLGFLYVKTESGQKFFVALERLQKQCQNDAAGTNASGKGGGLSPQAAPSLASDDYKHRSYPPVYHSTLYKVEDDFSETNLSLRPGKPVAPASPLAPSVLSAMPGRLDFSLLSSSSSTLVSFLAVQNPKDYPIKIMRSGVAVEVDDDQEQPNPEELGLHMSVKIKNNLLGPDALTGEALMVSCSIDWEKFESHKLESLFFHGNAILRATAHVDFDYAQWIKNLVKTSSKKQKGQILISDDYASEPDKTKQTKQTEFVLEIPLSVSIVKGKLGIMIHRTSHPFPHLWAVRSWKEGLGSVSSIFYPERPFDIKGEELLSDSDERLTESIFDRRDIEHVLRIFANIHMPSRVDSGERYQPQMIRLAEASISSDFNATSSDAPDRRNLCNRFRIELSGPPHESFPFKGFNDVGVVNLFYDFPDSSDSVLEDGRDNSSDDEYFHADPTYCYLSFTTDPFTERHQIPLVIYPGQSEITGMQSLSSGASTRTESVKAQKLQRERNIDWTEAASDALVGFNDLARWFRSSKAGMALRDLLKKSYGDSWSWHKREHGSDLKLLETYVKSLFPESFNLHAIQLNPILLKVGAIRQGTVETASFYMTNHNPVPLLVSVDIGEVEGMSISLARVPTRGLGDGHNILDHFPKKKHNPLGGHAQDLVSSGDLKGHPLEGLRKFLRTSVIAQKFLGDFRFRDAITMSQAAVGRQPLLTTLYKKYAFGEFHRDPLPIRFGEDSWSNCRRHADPPNSEKVFVDPDYEYNLSQAPEDGSFDTSSSYSHEGKGPLLISEDSHVAKELKVCWNKDLEPTEYPSDGTYTIIPPGAVARFDLKLHAPPKALLRDDITRFLSTGLVLSTDHGEKLPVFVTFEALLGEIKLSVANQTEEEYTEAQEAAKAFQDVAETGASVIQVPANLFYETQHPGKDMGPSASLDTEYAVRKSVPLRMNSSFSSVVTLAGMTSCNPWFEVEVDDAKGSKLRHPSSQANPSNPGLDVGKIRSAINCKPRKNSIVSLVDFPSFYQCATNWLASRAELQAQGCGGTQVLQKKIKAKDENTLIYVAELGGVKRALRSFEKALLISSFAFDNEVKSQNQGLALHSDGIIAPTVLDVFADAWDAWRVVSNYVTRMLTTTLTATIEYDSMLESNRKDKAQVLSVSIRDTVVATILATPKLLDHERANAMSHIPVALIGDDTTPSTIDFKPTLVADITSLTIPLQNPTSVPVRVRLAVAPNQDPNGAEDKNPLKTKFGIDDELRNSFTGYSESPFVQNGAVSAEHQWWDGYGGYFLADNYGDTISSFHTVRFVADDGAQVSLVNPSLQSNIAFLAGCGVRCGIRDKKNQPKEASNETAQPVSPIGSAAAVGITLSGRTRSSLPQANVRMMDEPLFSAGGAFPGKDGGPSAFALPYSALNEIVIPPYGKVEIGPILFRPPGRYKLHGCQTSLESRSIHGSGNEEKAKACSSNIYESMVYLENSLSGLERILLRGRALWEKVIFIDPPPAHHYADDFGDIEMRHGRQTLVFPGSKDMTEPDPMARPLPEKTVSGSVIKEVLLVNDGDTTVTYDGIYMSDSTIANTRHSHARARSTGGACSFKQFRLMNCLDEENETETAHGLKNLRYGFTLHPGQNVSLYIEHFPDCHSQRDFVAVNLKRPPLIASSGVPGRVGWLSQLGSEYVASERSMKAFRQHLHTILVGYDMSDKEFSSCRAIRQWGFTISDLHEQAHCATKKQCRGNWLSRLKYRLFLLGRSTVIFVFTTVILVAAYSVIFRGYMFRRQSSDVFSSALLPRRKSSNIGVSDKATTQQNNWSAAFRCLARADPTSTDLQALGREQIRHVVLGRYKTMGILSPQCFNSNGVFKRERIGLNVSGTPSGQISGKDGSTGGGNDRVRTLSEAIYRYSSTHQDEFLRRSLPIGLSWRVAVARGVALPTTPKHQIRFRSSELLQKRFASNNALDSSPDDSNVESEDDPDDDSSTSSSSEPSDDESIEADNVDEEESVRQGSLISELSEDIPATPDDISDTAAFVAAEAAIEDDISAAVPSGSVKEKVMIPSASTKSADSPPVDILLEDKKDSTNAANQSAKPNLAVEVENAKSMPSDNEYEKIERKEATFAAPANPKKKEVTQEQKNDRKSRQAHRTKSPVRSETGECSADRSQSTLPGKMDSRSKATESAKAKGKGAREKAKTASSDNSKQPIAENSKITNDKKGKLSGKKDREKKSPSVATENNKYGRVDQDEPKSTKKKRGKQTDPSEGTKKNSNESKTTSIERREKPEKKSKAAKKREKKGRADKASNSETKKMVDAKPELDPVITATTEAPAGVPFLRPPPGLAPPPGFGGQSSTLARPTSSYDTPLLTPSAFLTDANILGSTSSAGFNIPSISTTTSAFGGLGPSLLNTTRSTNGLSNAPLVSGIGATLNGAGAGGLEPMLPPQRVPASDGFNVMDFLDSILDDSNTNTNTNAPPLQTSSSCRSALPGMGDPNTAFLTDNVTATRHLPHLSLDPWATERTSSRATNYGIPISGGMDTASTASGDTMPPPTSTGTMNTLGVDSSSSRSGIGAEPINSMPLLYSVLYSHQTDDDEEEDNGDSFYASLLGKPAVDDDDDR